MRLFGLTGNIGAGKSTVARLLAQRGVPVIDADKLAREVVQPGEPALEEIKARFGPDVFQADGSLDRKALGARVFANAEERAALNAIVHPRIAQASARRIAALAEAGHKAAVYEAALIVENGLDKGMDGLIVVDVPEELQLTRLRARDGLTEPEARARLAAQLPAARKRERATFLIENHGSETDLEAQVAKLMQVLSS
ncbi:MAG TPA: dephospho-CoA kinase [Myxococcales bacterium]|nr:dephospho-CoA kinase [Myxococcales bacterium]